LGVNRASGWSRGKSMQATRWWSALQRGGAERRAFKQYVRDLQGAGAGVPFNYNSWWTTPVPFSESDCLDLLETFYRKLYERTGQRFDTFTLDMGWSNSRSLWGGDKKFFPDGFARLKRSAE